MPESGEDGPSDPKRARTDDDAKTSDGKMRGYARSRTRVTKDNLYMIIALWMQDFKFPGMVEPSDADKPSYHRVGAVLVLPNDVIHAADCSRNGVHAVARLLIKHSDKAEGCKMFVSRKPCPICAKLLVQSKVKRVLYLPFQKPEYYRLKKADNNHNMMKQIENMFTANAIAQTRFVFQVESKVLTDASSRKAFRGEDETLIEREREKLDKYGFEGNEEWKEVMKEELPWPAFDNDIDSQVQVYFDNAMRWIAQTNVLSGKGPDYDFTWVGPSQECTKTLPIKHFDPVGKPDHADQARHFITIARFLAERTDDPKTGVGAVIVSPKTMDILAFGWNGFPFKAYYGEFARASDDDQSTQDKKYAYVIHAEQNAIMMRNTKCVEGAILFVTKSPCDECAPMIAMAGINTVVVDERSKEDDVERRKNENKDKDLGYSMFVTMVQNGEIVRYDTEKKKNPEDKTGSPEKRELQF